MKLVKAFSLLAAMLVLSTGAARVALANDLVAEPAQLSSHLYYDMGTGAIYVPKGGAATQLAGDVYNNTNPVAPPNFGISSTDFTSQWGDELLLTGTGILQEHDFTVFNSGGGGSLLTATVDVSLFNATSSAFLGGFSADVNFGGLPSGFFSIVTVTGLGGLNINVNTTDVVVLQQISAYTGTPARLGVASLDPPSIGTSPATMYINSSTVGPAGFYNVGANNANPGYRVNVNQPVPANTKTWGSVKALYH